MRSTILLGLLALLLRAASAQTQPEVADILKKVSETYKGVSQYELVAEQTITLPGSNTPARARVRVAFKAPNRYRLEGTLPGLVPNDSNFDETPYGQNSRTR